MAQALPGDIAPMLPWYGPSLDELESEWLSMPMLIDGFGENRTTVQSWIDRGRLKAYRHPGSGRVIVHVTDLIKFLHPIPQVEG